MRHKKRKKILGRKSASRKALVKSLCTAFFKYKKIKTTVTKAKMIKPIIEKLVTLAKTDSLGARRKALRLLPQKEVQKLFKEIGPAYKDRKGGYTRVIKLETRKGDNSVMALIELI